MRTIVSVFSIAAAIAIALRLYLMRENARRDKLAENLTAGDTSEGNLVDEEKDITDKEDIQFRYLM